jgi:hypothetical protein
LFPSYIAAMDGIVHTMAGRDRLLTGIDGVSNRPLRRIVLMAS